MILEKVYDELYGMIEDLQKKIGKGGGSTVTITPTLQSGEKLADYSIDGTEGTIYAPTPESMQKDYSSEGLEYATVATLAAGGYAKYGNLVVVNIRLTVSDTISANVPILAGLPVPNATAAIVTVHNNKGLDIAMNQYGAMSCSSQSIQAGTLLLNCVYLTAPATQNTRTKTTKKK